MSSSSANTSEYGGASFNWNSGLIPSLLKEYKDDVPKFKIPQRSSYISTSKSKSRGGVLSGVEGGQAVSQRNSCSQEDRE